MIRKLAEAPEAEGQTLNIGNEAPEVTIKELAETVLSIVGKPSVISNGGDTPGSPVRRCPSMKTTESIVGRGSRVPLREGIQKTFDWYKEYIFDGNEVCEK
jgi:nucleoside-diphosphate-sugar epimerase